MGCNVWFVIIWKRICVEKSPQWDTKGVFAFDWIRMPVYPPNLNELWLISQTYSYADHLIFFRDPLHNWPMSSHSKYCKNLISSQFCKHHNSCQDMLKFLTKFDYHSQKQIWFWQDFKYELMNCFGNKHLFLLLNIIFIPSMNETKLYQCWIQYPAKSLIFWQCPQDNSCSIHK